MKVVSTIILQRVISGPGDCIRYDYAYHNNGDEYHFIPIDNDFRYAQHINYWKIVNVIEIDRSVIEISETYDCNPNTVMECIRTIQEDRSYNEIYTDISR